MTLKQVVCIRWVGQLLGKREEATQQAQEWTDTKVDPVGRFMDSLEDWWY